MNSLELKILQLDRRAIIPEYQTPGSAGFDFHCLEDVSLRAGEVTLVRTGLAVEVPPGFELQVRARSVLASRQGIFLVNGVGTIDSDYRGEVKIIMSTCLSSPVHLKAGDRVAQGILAPVERAQIVQTTRLAESPRGVGGFGSTGISTT